MRTSKIQYSRQGAQKWLTVYPKVFGCSCQLLLYLLFDPSTPYMRKGCDGEVEVEEEEEEVEKNDKNSS